MAGEKVTRFKGLNNVTDPMRLDLSWLVTANNIDITDTGAIKARPGYGLSIAGAITGAYGTKNYRRAYYVDAGILKSIDGAVLAAVTSTDPMHWAEINDAVFYSNGTDSGIIDPDNTVRPWAWPVPGQTAVAAVTGNLPAGQYSVVCTFILPDGRETGAGEPASIELDGLQALQVSSIPQIAGLTTCVYLTPAGSEVYQLMYEGALTAIRWNTAPESLGIDLMTFGMKPLPSADTIAFWRGRAYAAEHFPGSDQSVVWPSQPLGFHLFDLTSDFVPVNGQVLMLAPTTEALVIGTDKAIYAWDGETLTELAADYGVVPGWCAADGDGKTAHFWTQRGVCRAMPFTNLTEGHLSVAPGVQAGASVIERDGQRRFVVSLHQGGTAFNKRN